MGESGRLAKDDYRIAPERQRKTEDMVAAITGKGISGWRCGVGRHFDVISGERRPGEVAREIYFIALMVAREIGNGSCAMDIAYKCPEVGGFDGGHYL